MHNCICFDATWVLFTCFYFVITVAVIIMIFVVGVNLDPYRKTNECHISISTCNIKVIFFAFKKAHTIMHKDKFLKS